MKEESLKRKTIKVQQSISEYEFEGSLDSVRDRINGWIEQYGEMAHITISRYYEDMDCSIEWTRPETDDEYQARLTAAKKAADRKKTKAERDAIAEAEKLKNIEHAERVLLSQLKKKYENS